MKTKKMKTLCLMLAIVMSFTCFAPSSTWLQIGQAVNVEAASKPKLSKTNVVIGKGETMYLKVTGTSKKVKWKASNKKVVTVNSKGKIKAVNYGITYVYATVSGKTLKCRVSVQKTMISDTWLSLIEDETCYLKIVGTCKKTTWTSTNTNVAIVNKNGKVKGVGEGETIITGTVNGKKYKCKVEVLGEDDNNDPTPVPTSVPTPTPKPSIIFETNNTEINMNKYGTAYVSFGADISGGTLYRTVADNSILQCSWAKEWNGNTIALNITGLKTGKTTITVTNTLNSEKIIFNVNVDLSPNGISLNETSKTVNLGEDFNLAATVTPDYATNASITWTSSNTDVADVYSGGHVYTKAAGQTTITATTKEGNYSASCVVTVVSSINIKLPTLPSLISSKYSDGRTYAMCNVTKVYYEVSKVGGTYYCKLYMNGTKTYDSEGSNYSRACAIGYKLYKNGIVVATGTFVSQAISVNETFGEKYTYITGLKPGDYELVLLNTK